MLKRKIAITADRRKTFQKSEKATLLVTGTFIKTVQEDVKAELAVSGELLDGDFEELFEDRKRRLSATDVFLVYVGDKVGITLGRLKEERLDDLVVLC